MKQDPSATPRDEATDSSTSQKPKSSRTRTSKNVTMHVSSDAPDFRKSAKATSQATPIKQTVTIKSPTRRKTRHLHHIPVTTLPEDENLDEVLDESIEDDSILEEIPLDAPEEIPVPSSTPNSFSRIRARREKQTAENAASLEHVRRKSGFSEDDIAMLLELGYDSELGRLIGYENLKKLKYEHQRRKSRKNHKHYRTSFGYRGTEDINAETYPGVMATYLHDRKFLILRTVLTAFVTLILLFLDHPQIIGGAFYAFSLELPLFFPILSLLFLLGVSLLSYRQFNAGLRSYFKLKPSPYSTIAALLPITVIYDIAALFSSQNLVHVNFITSGILLMLAFCDVLRLICEMRTVRLLSTEGVKTVLEPTLPRKKKLRQGKKLVKIINDDIDESFYRVHQTEATTGFFRRFNTMAATHRPFHVLLGLTPALGFVSAFVSLIISGDFHVSASVFMTVLMVAAPFSAIFSFFYPLCRANKLLSRAQCALVGEEAVQEYGESKTIIFSDTDLYSAEKCTEIAVRESDDFRADLQLAGILFRKIGGTLESIGKTAPSRASDPPVSFVRIADAGVEAVVDNRHHMIAGSAEFLKKSGVRVSRESADKALRRTPNVSMMYVAIDGVLKLSYEIEYTIKPEFEALALALSEIDTAVAIQSYDPNLNELFLHAGRGDHAIPIRVIKPGKYEADTVSDMCDTGAVALGAPEDIVYPLYAAKGILSVKKFGLYLQFIVSGCGAVLATLFSLLTAGKPLEWVTPLSLALYHLLWILVTLVVSRIYINRRTLHLGSHSRSSNP